MKKSARTISGVTPVAVMTQPRGCPGRCVYCPTYEATPQSYTPESPAVLRGRSCDYDARAQVRIRLQILADMGHPVDKIELIIMGGTFLAAPLDYQFQFIKDCFDELNGSESLSLAEAKTKNETAVHRCTGLCIETRPDWCGPEEIDRMIEFGTTRVELGVQTLDEDIFRLVRRGHGVEAIVQATRQLRNAGLKVHYHWMPGLPGATPQKDLEMAQMLFSDPRFRPDGLKLYPTMVVAGTELEKWYRDGLYVPYDNQTMMDILLNIKAMVPKYVRISRVLRDIPHKYITGGCKESLREMVRRNMEEQDITCHCIRCREYGHRQRIRKPIGDPGLDRFEYDASEGKEIFLSFEDEFETLFGMLRLRIQSGSWQSLSPNSSNQAIIRELHIFGPELPLNMRNENAAQHKGLGRALLAEAERISREEFHSPEITVLSGVGAREYYRDSGYFQHQGYMVKLLPSV